MEFIPCRDCAKKPGPKPGYYYVDFGYQKAAVECSCHKEYMKQKNFLTAAPEAGIWVEALRYDPEKDYVGIKSKINVERVMKYVMGFEKYSSELLYFWGPNGTQKTTLAQWVGASLLFKGYTVKYLLMQNLLSLLTSKFDSDDDKIKAIDKLYTADLLIIDESFSKDKVTLYESGYQLPFLDRFIRERAEIRRKGIIFISNKGPTTIESQKFSKSIQDFVERNTKRSCLYFEDNYMQTVSDFEPTSIFD